MAHKPNPKLQTVVFCTVQFQGIHQWANCPHEEVKYLRDLHRHIFHVKAYKQVFHNDRDVEFIMMKNAITKYLANRFPNHVMGSMSCEMLAEELIEKFDLVQCEVNEDGENGAIVTKRSYLADGIEEPEEEEDPEPVRKGLSNPANSSKTVLNPAAAWPFPASGNSAKPVPNVETPVEESDWPLKKSKNKKPKNKTTKFPFPTGE